MTSFAFVPRAVSRYTTEWQGISRRSPSPSPSPTPDPTTDSQPDDDHESSNGKEKAIEPANPRLSTIAQDIASLFSLALSDYKIWFDPDLRWKLDACLQNDVSPDDAGFVPINYLLRRAPFRGSLSLGNSQPEPSETEVVKALRAHAGHTLEVRMRLPFTPFSSASASSVWYGTGKTSRKKDVGGYEVRRRDWPTLRHRPSRGWSRARWDDLTAYMECIPPQYRTVGSIARFAESLLLEADADADIRPHLRIQYVNLPLHYLDKPGDAPKCKGYALVTFTTKSNLEAVLRAWPWKRRRMSVPANEDASIIKEAHKYGFRAISKARWEALNEEYLAYRHSLVEELARAETEMQRKGQGVLLHGESTSSPPLPHPETMQTMPSSPYPFDCLVFVRNVHPDTNKTTLKSLFSRAFQDGSSSLDYVDFNKGMDTCFLRLASPDHATRLTVYFETRPKTQASGLDSTGRTPLGDDKPITMERVRGKKEEVYWDKIPEKVRRQAVDKVVQAQLANGAESGIQTESATTTTGRGNGASGSKRKNWTRAC